MESTDERAREYVRRLRAEPDPWTLVQGEEVGRALWRAMRGSDRGLAERARRVAVALGIAEGEAT